MNTRTIDLTEPVKRYTDLLRDLFDSSKLDPFEYACALLRVGGLEDAGWDPLAESKAVFEDIVKLTQLELDQNVFADVEKTKLRLMLLAYAHLVEMDAPYNVIANLLRVRNGERYTWDPFWDIREKKKGKRKQVMDLIKGPVPVYPVEKIERIKTLASQVGLAQIEPIFDDFFSPVLRNSIDHSDYVLYKDELRMAKGRMKDPRGVYSPVVGYDHLLSMISDTYGFCWTFFALEDEARHCFKNLAGLVFPFDPKLKGLLEFNIRPDGFLNGFTVHWPNNSASYFIRDEKGCQCCNIRLDNDLAVTFFVGEYFSPHNPFSPLVDVGKEPSYSSSVYNSQPLKWSATHYELSKGN
jgi:hypothetical protein